MFVVMSACAKMPLSVNAPYKRVAVVETDGVNMPKIIHPRHRAVKRIVHTWERLFDGRTDRCAYRRVLRQAHALADQLNSQQQVQI